ncbi:uncharacterized protein LOC117653711 isoform X2 [Thrips palmi]|uniref:Uncharacterized protein LOC117653711 isoform X2 n=1 Tax=Thrips palmi TaxID=161013 RepID=A0A6P9AD71_THRPL|nr:uncharacterized protein LOC117653711 isoform X2 [Thrips palmi]
MDEEEDKLTVRDGYAISALLKDESGETDYSELDEATSDILVDDDILDETSDLEVNPPTGSSSQTLAQLDIQNARSLQLLSTPADSTCLMDVGIMDENAPLSPDLIESETADLTSPACPSAKRLKMSNPQDKEHIDTADSYTFTPMPYQVASPSNVDTDFDSDAGEHQLGAEYFSNYNSDEESNFFHESSATADLLDEMALQSSDEEESESTSSKDNVSDPPLYKGAPITQWESLTSILAFVSSEHLSGAGLERLLSLIDLHLPQPNKFCKTKAQLFKVLQGVEEPAVIHYFCSICYKIRKGPNDLCDSCTDINKCVLYFISFSLESQLKKMFERPDFVENIKYKQTRNKKNSENIEDVCDGEVYKEAAKSFDESCFTITLMWNTDGMQVFTSNTFSLWPFYLVINELPPKKRFLSENLLIGGIWGSVVKPHPNVFLLPIYKELKALERGIDVKFHSDNNLTKVVVKCICGTCDSPAKATFLNMKSHSGFYSCPVCLTRGLKPKDAPVVFPYEENVQLRNMPQYQEHVKWAVDHKVIFDKTPRDEEKWCGIKGPTVLSSIVPNIFDSTATDCMHCVDLGVMRQMLHLWFDKEYKDQPFSVFKKTNEVNKRLLDLTPPHYLQRTPQTIDKLIHWKATELRSFLVNLSLIVMKDILLPEYYAHLALFVKGVSLLNSSSVSDENLVLSSLLNDQFVADFEELYGLENMSFNLHLLRHLARCVKKLGPLWIVCCYKLEDINGRIGNFIHGTCHVGLQVYSNLSIVTRLPLLVKNLADGLAKKYCEGLMKKRLRLKISEKISGGLYCVGPFKLLNSDYIIRVLESLISEECNVQLFYRLLKDGLLYVSNLYTRGKRVSSYVKYKKDNSVLYGNIKTFVKISCVCTAPCDCKCDYVAIIKPKPVHVLQIGDIEISHISTHKCTDLCNDTTTFDVILVTELQTVVFKIDGTEKMYLCEPLNEFERD